jgi:hypothetical protein
VLDGPVGHLGLRMTAWPQDNALYSAEMILPYPPTHIGQHRLDSADFALLWPRDIFENEALVLADDVTTDRQELLLEEAFVGPVPAQALRRAAARAKPGSKSRVFDALVSNVHILQLMKPKLPYYSRRTHGESTVQDPFARLTRQFVDLIEDLTARGYFDHLVAARPCVDADVHTMEAYIVEGSRLLEKEIGRHVSWPLRRDEFLSADRDLLFDVIEVLHDHVARPRERTFHDFCDCGWHYADFVMEAGRQVYRWRVNQLLDQAVLGYRLAGDGEDVGRLVTTTDEARTDLLQSMNSRTDPASVDEVRHAISLFRTRGAIREDKRSACTALARVLEDRRRQLKTELFSKDEGALFTIANEFDVRHSGERQKNDYRAEFLDWVFWWYLATIELTDRLLSDQSSTTTS